MPLLLRTSRTMSSVLHPQLRLVHVFLAHAFRRAGAEPHLVLLEPENLEILQIHLVDRVELGGKLLRRAIDMRVVHVERPHPHQAEQLARLLVAITGAVFGEPRSDPATPRLPARTPVAKRRPAPPARPDHRRPALRPAPAPARRPHGRGAAGLRALPGRVRELGGQPIRRLADPDEPVLRGGPPGELVDLPGGRGRFRHARPGSGPGTRPG